MTDNKFALGPPPRSGAPAARATGALVPLSTVGKETGGGVAGGGDLVTTTRAWIGAAGAQLRIYNSADQPISGKCIAIYSKPGVGKTSMVEQLADCKYTAPVLYVNIEGGAWVLGHRSDITIVDVYTYTDFTNLTSKIISARRPEDVPFKSVVMDNWSELQALNIMGIMGMQGSGVHTQAGMASQQQWGASTAQLLAFMRGCHDAARRLGITFVFMAWEDLGKDAGESVYRRGIGFTPALAKSFPGIVDIVGHLTVKNDPPHYTRVLNFASNPLSDAKFRRKRDETAMQIPLTIAFRQQPVLRDLLNTLIGGEKWPTAQYKALEGQATVTQVPVPPQAPNIVEQSVAAHAAQGEEGTADTTDTASSEPLVATA